MQNETKEPFETTVKVLGEGCPALACADVVLPMISTYNVVDMGLGLTHLQCSQCGQRFIMPW